MAFTNVTLTNTAINHTIIAPVGFSWTNFFFGFWVPVFRGDWQGAAILFLLALVGTFFWASLWAFPVYMMLPVLYNRSFISRKVQQGYVLSTPMDLTAHNLTCTHLFPMTASEKSNFITYIVVGVVFIAFCGLVGAML